MNRGSGFKRPTIERKRTVHTPAPEGLAARVSMARADSAAQPVAKDTPVRHEGYRRLVALLPCCICGIDGYSQAAHASAGKGMGLKASDLELFPACADRPGARGCHSRLDQSALFTKAARHALEPAWVADTQRKIETMGLWPATLKKP
jgi:hypothetical protein